MRMQTAHGRGVPVALAERARDAANRRDADTGALVDLAVGNVFEKQGDDAPALAHGFELGRRAEIFEKRTHFGWIVE